MPLRNIETLVKKQIDTIKCFCHMKNVKQGDAVNLLTSRHFERIILGNLLAAGNRLADCRDGDSNPPA